MSDKLVTITETKDRLSELIREAEDLAGTVDHVVVTRHGRPAAVLMSWQRHEALLDAIEDLEDQLAYYRRQANDVETSAA